MGNRPGLEIPDVVRNIVDKLDVPDTTLAVFSSSNWSKLILLARLPPFEAATRQIGVGARCKNTLKMCRLCFVIKVSNAPGLGAMNSLGAQTARRVKRLAVRSVGCIIRLFAEDAADVNGRLHRCQVESERTVAQRAISGLCC
jgi:hypothetical protein